MIDPAMAAHDRLWPNTYILGNPKSGSTFLFACLRAGPFDPNLLLGTSATSWRNGAYMLTTLGTKKEFNFWGGPGYAWGWDWYLGAPAPLSAWEWAEGGNIIEEDGHPRRRGENGNGDPSPFVENVCRLRLNATPPATTGRERRRRGPLRRSPCVRFPLECVNNAPVVRPGCALVRPFPPRRHCGGTGQRACEMPRVRMSHAWPPTSETSPRAIVLDPSINTFMSSPAAPVQLRSAAGSGADALRFVVLLREPLARAQSSARMMREWKWDRSANTSAALLYDLSALRQCCDRAAPADRAAVAMDGASGMEVASSPWQRAASELLRMSDTTLGRFRACLARHHPLNHVRASVYAAGVLGWMSAGFSPRRFLWLETEAMRAMSAEALLTAIASFADLPTAHLSRLPPRVRGACEARQVGGGRQVGGESSRPRRGGAAGGGAAGRRLLAMAAAPPPHVDERMRVHAHRALSPATVSELRDAFRPFNTLLRTLLQVRDLALSSRRPDV